MQELKCTKKCMRSWTPFELQFQKVYKEMYENPTSISEHTIELDHAPSYENRLDILTSYPFPEIEIEPESDPEPQVDD